MRDLAPVRRAGLWPPAVLLVAVLAIVFSAARISPAAAQENTGSAQWIHVRVEEQEGAKVSVNLPISLLEVALEIAQEHVGEEGHGIHFGKHHRVDVERLRQMWAELREAGDAEYVSVKDEDESVRIYRRGEVVHIEVDEDGREAVRMQVPFSVVDVLLQGEDDRLNLVGALRELARSNGGQVVQVNDEEARVRIWIDDTPGEQE